jgi:hypothetical protein
MRWRGFAAGVLTLVAVLAAAVPGAAAKTSGPTLSIEQDCWADSPDSSQLVYGVDIRASGFPANASFMLESFQQLADGTTSHQGPGGPFLADANGNFGPFAIGTVGVASTYTISIYYGDLKLVQTVESDCDPIRRSQCRNGGWMGNSRFLSEADCVAFVKQANRTACQGERARLGRAAFRETYLGRHPMRKCIRLRGKG